MQDIECGRLKGDAGEELGALEIDVTGKMARRPLSSSCHGAVRASKSSRFCVMDNVLKDHGAAGQELYNRARGLLLLSAIFKSTVLDESGEERRQLERMVSEAIILAHKIEKEAGAHAPNAAMLAAQDRAHEARNAANGHSATTTIGGSTGPTAPGCCSCPGLCPLYVLKIILMSRRLSPASYSDPTVPPLR